MVCVGWQVMVQPNIRVDNWLSFKIA